MTKKSVERKEGMALLLALFFIIVALISLGYITSIVINQKRQVDKSVNDVNAVFGVDAATVSARAVIERGAALPSSSFPGIYRSAAGAGVHIPIFDLACVHPRKHRHRACHRDESAAARPICDGVRAP